MVDSNYHFHFLNPTVHNHRLDHSRDIRRPNLGRPQNRDTRRVRRYTMPSPSPSPSITPARSVSSSTASTFEYIPPVRFRLLKAVFKFVFYLIVSLILALGIMWGVVGVGLTFYSLMGFIFKFKTFF
jgi:hypothetical protein